MRSSIYHLFVEVALTTRCSGRMRAAAERLLESDVYRTGHLGVTASAAKSARAKLGLAGLPGFIEGSFQVLGEFLAASSTEVESGAPEAQNLRAVRA